MQDTGHPRAAIERLTETGDIEALLRKAGELHGHFCPYLCYGVRAGYAGLRELEITSNTGMENVMAIVETNSCFSDGVQMVSGCTFGNNALVFEDVGKTAVTIARRGGGAARVSLKAAARESFASRYPEAQALFQRVVVQREDVSEEESRTMMRLWREVSFGELGVPEEDLFNVEKKDADIPGYASIFASVVCSVCGESVMETRARIVDGKPVCIRCAGAERYVLTGNGILVLRN